MRVVATAGHVDHGKSTLVKALTGTDPDRLTEEKERGLTIDLGFASARLPSGAGVSFVDVPGHVRFIKNMLAGVGAVDACLFVVDAGEGWKPQSEEHLRILELLGLSHGVIALTKVAELDDDMRALARLDVDEHVEGTFLADAEIVEVDALADLGLDGLRAALERLVATIPAPHDLGRPRLWVDRVFAARGAGTVVTGTLTGGSVRVGDQLLLEPQETTVRVRAIESQYEGLETIEPGNRTALNLSGVTHDRVSRGDALVRSGQWTRARRVDASLRVLAGLDHAVSRRGAYVAYLGSGEHPVRVRVLQAAEIRPGETGSVRIHLPQPLPLLPGDRFVLRESGRAETVGGGEVLDVDPVLPAPRARPDRSVDRVIAERGWVTVDHLELLTGERREPTVGDWVVDASALREMTERVSDRVSEAGGLGLDLATLGERERAVLPILEGIVVESGRAVAGEPTDLSAHPFLEALDASPFSPPPPLEVDPVELRELVRRGLVVEADGLHFAATAVDAAASLLSTALSTRPEGLTVSEIREVLGTTRKFALPLLAILDGTGVTRRRDDRRVAGPRMPAPG